MRTTTEVLERMGQLVVHVRHQYGDGPNEYEQQTVVLDETSAVKLCGQIGEVLSKRTAGSAPKERPLRWYKFSARATERRGPVEAYGRGRDEREAKRNSVFRDLHDGEVVAAAMPEDFCPPNGSAKKVG